MITDDDMTQAIARLARTPDGALLYLFLQRKRLALPDTIEPCALTVHTGERSFAAKLMALMADAIAEQAVAGPDHASERPVVFAPPEPAGRRRVTAREYFAANDDPFNNR